VVVVVVVVVVVDGELVGYKKGRWWGVVIGGDRGDRGELVVVCGTGVSWWPTEDEWWMGELVGSGSELVVVWDVSWWTTGSELVA